MYYLSGKVFFCIQSKIYNQSKVYYNCVMDSILPSDQYTEVEGRLYANPQTGLEESSTFIDKLREAQGAQNQEIIEQTQALGTNIPSAQGGLTGPESYFTSRYQTPQNVSAVANLRATAQAQALNEVLANEEGMWKKRYQDAYRSYQKRQHDKANRPTTITPTTPTTTTKGGVYENPTDSSSTFNYSSSVSGVPGYYTVVSPDGRAHLVDMETGEETVVLPEPSNGSGSGGSGWSGGGTGGGGIGGR